MITIEFTDWTDIQKYQEKYQIPLVASITEFVGSCLQGLCNDGYDEVTLIFNPELLPKSRQVNPAYWAAANVGNRWSAFSYITGHRKAGRVQIVATAGEHFGTFMQQVVATLQRDRTLTIPIEEIPAAHQLQPYKFICILKEKFPNEKPKVRINPTSHTYYLSSKTKLHPVKRNRGGRTITGRNLDSRSCANSTLAR